MYNYNIYSKKSELEYWKVVAYFDPFTLEFGMWGMVKFYMEVLCADCQHATVTKRKMFSTYAVQNTHIFWIIKHGVGPYIAAIIFCPDYKYILFHIMIP